MEQLAGSVAVYHCDGFSFAGSFVFGPLVAKMAIRIRSLKFTTGCGSMLVVCLSAASSCIAGIHFCVWISLHRDRDELEDDVDGDSDDRNLVDRWIDQPFDVGHAIWN